MKTVVLAALLATFGAAALAAEPPACADRAITRTVQELFWEQKLHLQTTPTEADGKAWLAFNDFQVSNVVALGYDDGMKRRRCEGSIGKGRQPVRVPFTVQTSDSGNPVVRADFSGMPDAQATALRELIVRVIGSAAR